MRLMRLVVRDVPRKFILWRMKLQHHLQLMLQIGARIPYRCCSYYEYIDTTPRIIY